MTATLFQIGFDRRVGDLSQLITRSARNFHIPVAAAQEHRRHHCDDHHLAFRIQHFSHLNRFDQQGSA
jgi:hypothetical protein